MQRYVKSAQIYTLNKKYAFNTQCLRYCYLLQGVGLALLPLLGLLGLVYAGENVNGYSTM